MKDSHASPDVATNLYRDAIKGDQQLKRKYLAQFQADPKAFRSVLRKARSRVFRIKPGPKPSQDPRFAKAARERARGRAWHELYPLYIENWKSLTEYTQSLAEDGLRRKVNAYLRNHPKLKLTAREPECTQ